MEDAEQTESSAWGAGAKEVSKGKGRKELRSAGSIVAQH